MKLNGKQREFIIEYLKTHSIKESAKNIGIAEITANKWISQGLKDEIKKAESELYESAMNKLLAESQKVSSELIDIIESKTAPPNARIKAIELYFNQIHQYQTDIVSVEKINQLERLANNILSEEKEI